MKRVLGIIAVVVVIGVLAAGAHALYRAAFVDTEAWYAQVDNARLSQAGENNNDFAYHYDLPAVDEGGSEREIGFDTSRELREGAYLKLETLALRGVVRWEEVAWDKIPSAAQEKLAPPEDGGQAPALP